MKTNQLHMDYFLTHSPSRLNEPRFALSRFGAFIAQPVLAIESAWLAYSFEGSNNLSSEYPFYQFKTNFLERRNNKAAIAERQT